jgi:hypothetical protein
MLIKTKVLNEFLSPVFEGQTKINANELVRIAKSREEIARSKGAEWAAGAIPFFGQELINTMKKGELGAALDKAAIEVAMVAWLFDSIYAGVDTETFIASDLNFTMTHDGIVRYDRAPAK